MASQDKLTLNKNILELEDADITIWDGDDQCYIVTLECYDGEVVFIKDYPTLAKAKKVFNLELKKLVEDTDETLLLLGPFNKGDQVFVNEELDDIDDMGWQKVIASSFEDE
jgi:hypothetical protein